MSNEDGLKADGITDEQIQEKIPQELRYACAYWVNHLEVANMEDEALVNGLERFAYEHMLYWLEVLSLIGKLDSAHRAILVIKSNKVTQTWTSSDLHQLLSDALQFISKFYEIIKRSALHTYYSALPFTPTDSLLYHRYIKEAEHKICSVEGGPEKWDALVATLRHQSVDAIKFSLDSTLFLSCSNGCVDEYRKYEQGTLNIWDAATGTPIFTIPGHTAGYIPPIFSPDCTRLACGAGSDNVTLWDIRGIDRRTSSPPSTGNATAITALTLSRDCSRLACGGGDGTVELWETSPTKR
ncbi:hypothetical protein M378DRAFT_75235, partial [Amanita muscaria Koide BX008]